MKKTIEKELNKQINEEMYSAYLYLAFAAHFESMNLKGFANYFKVQAREEMDHAFGFYNFVYDVNGKVELDTIEKPAFKFKSVKNMFELALEHEKHITSRINLINELAKKESDYPLENFIKWYINEQVEEENNAIEILAKLDILGSEKGTALYLLDKELGAREYHKASILK